MVKLKRGVPALVTREYLIRHNATCEALQLFDTVFPNGAEFTLQNCLKAARAGLSLEWFTCHCLPIRLQRQADEQCATIQRQAREQCATIWRQADEQCATIIWEVCTTGGE